MKQLSKPNVLSALCAGAGLLCLGLRQWLLSTGVDDRGLLVASHPGNRLSLILTGLVVLALILSLHNSQRCRLASSKFQALGYLAAAGGFAVACFPLLTSQTHMALPAGILALACAGTNGFTAVRVFRQKKPLGALLIPDIAFFMLLVLCRYQDWSSEPEFQRFGFLLLALVLLAITAYHRAALATNRKEWRLYVQFSRAAAFFSLAAIPGSGDGLCLILWALSVFLDGCVSAPRHKRQV